MIPRPTRLESGTVIRVRVPRYQAVRTVPSLMDGGEIEQRKNFANRTRAFEWIAWGWILQAREQCRGDGRWGWCCGESTKEYYAEDPDRKTPARKFCRYHDSERCQKVVKRLARWLRWRDRRLAELNKEGPI